MASRYWVGNGTNWSSTASWAAASGGASGQSVPTAADDVFLDALSPGNCVVDAGATCRNFDCTGFTKTLTLSAQLSTNPVAGGVITFVAGMTIGGSASFAITTAAGANAVLTMAGKSLFGVTLGGPGGVVLADNFTCSGTLTLNAGTFDTASKTVSCLAFNSSNSSVRTLTLGSSSFTCTGTGTPWTVATNTNLTITANTATITLSGTNATFQSGQTFMSWNGASLVFSGSGTAALSSGGTFANVTKTGTANKNDFFQIAGANALNITGNLTITGNSIVNRVWVYYGTVGTQKTIAVNGTVSLTNADFQDIAAGGTAPQPWTGTSLGDCGNNSGITFPASRTLYGVVAGNWSANATWSTSSGGAGGATAPPLPQDDVVLDANSAAGSYTCDMPRGGRNLNCTGFTRTLVNAAGANNWRWFGSVTLSAGMTLTGTQVLYMAPRSPMTATLTTAGQFLPMGVFFEGAGTMITLGDDLNTVAGITLSAGGLNDGGHNVTGTQFVCSANQARTLILGGGQWTLTTTTAGTVVLVSNPGTLTATVSPSTRFTVSGVTANVRTFQGDGIPYWPNVTFNGAVTIVTSSSYGTFQINPGATVNFTSGTTSTVRNFVAQGGPGNVITIAATTAGSRATLSCPSGNVVCDYLSVKDSAATGGATWYAGPNSTSVSNNTGWIFTAAPQAGVGISVFQRPPLRLIGEIAMPNGRWSRFARDAADPRMVPSGLTFSTTMPGGFEQCSFSLVREAHRTFADMVEFANVVFRSPGGLVAFEGRLQAAPRQVAGDLAISPEVVGWQAHLDDYSAAREVYLDSDFGQWTGPSVQMKINDDSAGWGYQEDPSVVADVSTGQPVLQQTLTAPISRQTTVKGLYNARGIPLGPLYYAWKIITPLTIYSGDANWQWFIIFGRGDVNIDDLGPNLRAAGSGSGSYSPSASNRSCVWVSFQYGAASSTPGTCLLGWTYLGVTGRSGIPIQGSVGATGGIGVLASDVIANVLSRWAPKLNFTTGPSGSIQPTGYSIPQAAYVEATTPSAIIADVTKWELVDWAIWENQTFYLNPWGQRGKHWQARIREAQLQDAGPQVDRIFNGVIVTYTDEAGVNMAAGPPNSGCPVTDPALFDADPTNPVTEAGLTRYAPPFALGTATAQGAISMGARYLQELKAASTAGQAALVGHVQDAMSGTWRPAWMVRAGDWISFVDASNTSYRRIVRTSYDDATKTNSVDLDSPPDDMQQMLERMNIDLARVP